MDLKNLLGFLRLIEEVPLEYMVSGSIASILYGKPRLTQDMDVVVIFPQPRIDAFIARFDTESYYCPPAEVIKEEIRRGDKGHLNIIDNSTGFKIDIYPFGDDPLIAWGLDNKKQVELIQGEYVWVAPPEYVIIKKLAYFSEGGSQKHLDDIRGIMDVSGDALDLSMIEQWIAKLGLADNWKLITSDR